MIKRILTAIIALCVLTPFLVFSHTNLLLIFTGCLSGIAMYEILVCAGLLSNPFISIPTFAVSTAVVIMTRMISDTNRYFTVTFLMFFTYVVYIMTVSVFSRGKVRVSDAAITAMAGIYIIFGFCSIVLLRDLKYGQYIYLLAFLVPWISDSGSYFVGINLGRHKLIPDVSPKKTVEGAVGGILFGVLSAIVFGLIISYTFSIEVSYPALIIAGFVMCILSQFGDLIASLIKRHYNKKDYGTVFPGHGGVMDRFDSIIATAPFLYILFTITPLFEIFF